MASVLTTPTPQAAPVAASVDCSPSTPCRDSARAPAIMGRAATVPQGLNWSTLVIIVAFHLGALAALFFFTWQRLLVMALLYVLAINVGIGMCYHRLLTHRGYHVPQWLEYLMTICATLSLEGGPIFWVATHRLR